MGNAFTSWSNFLHKTGGDPVAEAMHKPAGDALGLFTPKPVEPVAKGPDVAAKPVVEMPDQQAIAADKKKSIAEQIARRGRASTILTDQSEKLGG